MPWQLQSTLGEAARQSRQVHHDRRAAGVDFVALGSLPLVGELLDPVAVAPRLYLRVLEAGDTQARQAPASLTNASSAKVPEWA
jgi:hypothetical protein